MNKTDDYTINSELFSKGDAPTESSTLNIFKMASDDLYDDDEEEEYEAKPRKKGTRKLTAVLVIAVILALIGVGGVGFGALKVSKIKGLEAQIKELNQKIADNSTTIENLSNTITLKDQEIETLKNGGASVIKQDTANGETPAAKPNEPVSNAVGGDGSSYKVVSDRGMNIRAEANFDAEVVASLGYGDEFEQYGEVIRDAEGNIWVEMRWDDGYGCIQLADGTVIAKLS